MEKNLADLTSATISIIPSILWIILIVVILILWRRKFSSLVDIFSKRVNEGDSVKIGGIIELEKKVTEVHERQNDQDTILNAIRIALEAIITKYEVMHLKKLWTESNDLERYGPHFSNEIYRLDAIGFLRPTKTEGLRAMEKYNVGEEFHLREYAEITEKGKSFLINLEKLGIIKGYN